MKKKKIVTVALGMALVLAPATMALGATQWPAEGGKWDYGTWNSRARSYYTVDKCHGSTVKVDVRTSRSIDTAANVKSDASLTDYPLAARSYYYRTC